MQERTAKAVLVLLCFIGVLLNWLVSISAQTLLKNMRRKWFLAYTLALSINAGIGAQNDHPRALSCNHG
jgi:hypothetical protein